MDVLIKYEDLLNLGKKVFGETYEGCNGEWWSEGRMVVGMNKYEDRIVCNNPTEFVETIVKEFLLSLGE